MSLNCNILGRILIDKFISPTHYLMNAIRGLKKPGWGNNFFFFVVCMSGFGISVMNKEN